MLETVDYPITITRAHLESLIKEEKYYTPPGTMTTLCVMKLKNGTVITGEAHCLCEAMYTPSKGEVLSRERAMHKVHELESYLVRQKVYETENPPQ